MKPGKRFRIFHRDGFTCQYCGRRPPDVILEVDHVIPHAEGGSEDDVNLVTSCFECNRGKGCSSLSEPPETISEMMSQERERREQVKEYQQWLEELRADEIRRAAELGNYWYNLCRRPRQRKDRFTFSTSRTDSVRRFLQHLPFGTVMDAIDKAHSRFPVPGYDCCDERTWKYFCGICWNTIKSPRE